MINLKEFNKKQKEEQRKRHIIKDITKKESIYLANGLIDYFAIVSFYILVILLKPNFEFERVITIVYVVLLFIVGSLIWPLLDITVIATLLTWSGDPDPIESIIITLFLLIKYIFTYFYSEKISIPFDNFLKEHFYNKNK